MGSGSELVSLDIKDIKQEGNLSTTLTPDGELG